MVTPADLADLAVRAAHASVRSASAAATRRHDNGAKGALSRPFGLAYCKEEPFPPLPPLPSHLTGGLGDGTGARHAWPSGRRWS
jgi:hypothetical protein